MIGVDPVAAKRESDAYWRGVKDGRKIDRKRAYRLGYMRGGQNVFALVEEKILGADKTRSAATKRLCAVCGLLVNGDAVEPIKGIYGEGVRHADYTICMTAVGAYDRDE